MRRDDDTVTLCCPLAEMEQDFAAEMMRMTGVTTQADLVRLGLFHLARHLDMPIGQAFAFRRTKQASRLTRPPA